MMIPFFVFIVAYLLTGLYLTVTTPSRGLFADVLFVFVWGIHMVRHLQGKE